jgi:hypothetical protein
MKLFTRKPKELKWYEVEYARLQEALTATKPGTEEYEKIMTQLLNVQTFAGKNKEMNQVFDKQGRGNIVGKIVGFLGLGGLAFGLARFEKNGNFFSGTNNSVISGIVKLGTRFFG